MSPHLLLQAALFMGALGLLLGGGIWVANRYLRVVEDPRIDAVEALLPSSNCGACGNPGCRAFAEALVQGKENPAGCTVASPEIKSEVAALLGVELGTAVKRVARLACAGGDHVARQRTRYQGEESCRAAALTAGGGKGCTWGCLGLGDCGAVCDFDAIQFSANGLPVVNIEKCTACGDCVDICPKGLFSLQSITHQLWVNCKSLAFGDEAQGECAVACTGCGKCAMDASGGLISMRNNLPIIDYALNDFAHPAIIERCPTGAITWIEGGDRFCTGAAAKPVIRTRALPLG